MSGILGNSFGSHAFILQMSFPPSLAEPLDDGSRFVPVWPAFHFVEKLTDEEFIVHPN
jgi:hypothetical protein